MMSFRVPAGRRSGCQSDDDDDDDDIGLRGISHKTVRNIPFLPFKCHTLALPDVCSLMLC